MVEFTYHISQQVQKQAEYERIKINQPNNRFYHTSNWRRWINSHFLQIKKSAHYYNGLILFLFSI